MQTLANGSLLISATYMEDLGRYGCTAGSGAGFTRGEMYLFVTSESYMYPQSDFI